MAISPDTRVKSAKITVKRRVSLVLPLAAGVLSEDYSNFSTF